MPTFLINGVTPASLGLANPRLSYGSMIPDVLMLEHLTAAWDADPIFAYGQQITLTLDGVTVFVGKVRTFPRFAGPLAETTSYQVAGPWDWLQRRALLQNQAVVVDPLTSSVPTMVPQGLAILGQSDAGTAVTIASALATIIDQAIAAGVPILRGEITGLAYAIAWDEVADLTIADAIIRLLGSTPDAVCWWDYTTTTTGSPTPTLNISRRASLSATSLSIAPDGAGGTGSYALFESLRLTSRPDLVVPGVFVNYRRLNTVNGNAFLAIEQQTAGSGLASAENALCRTVTLAGSSFSDSWLTQDTKTAALPADLTSTATMTSGFASILAFLARGGNDWLNDTAYTITAIQGQGVKALQAGETYTYHPNELIEGAITPWMEDTALNRRGQAQTVTFKVTGTKDGATFITTVTRQFMATNCSTQTYSYQDSVSSVAAEDTPTGLAAAIYAGLSSLQHEGSFTLVESECTLAIRPGQVVNLTGGRTEWATMAAVVQQVAADLDTGKTEVTVGFATQLAPSDLMQIYRSNRLKRSAQSGLTRTTGTA